MLKYNSLGKSIRRWNKLENFYEYIMSCIFSKKGWWIEDEISDSTQSFRVEAVIRNEQIVVRSSYSCFGNDNTIPLLQEGKSSVNDLLFLIKYCLYASDIGFARLEIATGRSLDFIILCNTNRGIVIINCTDFGPSIRPFDLDDFRELFFLKDKNFRDKFEKLLLSKLSKASNRLFSIEMGL